ncbi:ATPase PAAT-like [Littorina saxatilis]|uniref:Uncharacterized protein n=1 Tax=Littorina saxatilis TaxID=31220 RepID=A0AAN9BS63_9CAEN
MTDYCTVTCNYWHTDHDPSTVIEYAFDDAEDTRRPHLKDHITLLGHRTQVTKPRGEQSEEDHHCIITLQCKPVCKVEIVRLAVASEARTLELYDGSNGSYLSTVKGFKDSEDSDADGYIVQFMCFCVFDEPLNAVKIKFLSLGLRETFEVARIKVVLQPCTTTSAPQIGRTVNMDKLKRDVENMGDSVSDEAKAFLTTLEKFQKNKSGAVDDVRHMLTDKNLATADGRTMAGVTNLLAMYANMQGGAPGSTHAEGSQMNNMLTQMMAMMAVNQDSAAAGGDKQDTYKFLQTVCGQVTAQREADQKEEEKAEQATVGDVESAADLESRVTKKVEKIVESRLSAVEQHIKEEVDGRMDEMETRMTNKLDAIFALLQNAQK